MAIKRCTICGHLKPTSCFSVRKQSKDGRQSTCKACAKQYREKHREHIKTYHHERYLEKQEHIRAMNKNWIKKNPERYAFLRNQWRKNNPEKMEAYKKSYKVKHPERCKAKTAVNNAIRNGRLVIQPCIICGTNNNVEAHHEDYSKPLDVVWLCRKHHKLEHQKRSVCA